MRKRQLRLNGVDEIVRSLYPKDLMNGEISAHFAEISAGSTGDRLAHRLAAVVETR